MPAQPARGPAAAGGGELAAALAAASRGEAGAPERLAALASRFPLIADFIAFWRAQALAAQRRHEEVAAALDPVWRTRFPSSIAARAALLGADSLIQAGRPKDAIALLERNFTSPGTEPRPVLLMARAHEQNGDPARAATLYQRLWCLHPASSEAEEAAKALAALAARTALPPVPEELRVERAERLARAGRHAQARAEWLALAASGSSSGVRELAQVGAAAALYEERKTRDALAALLALWPADAETDARRLYFAVLCHRRLDDPAPMLDALEQARRRAPSSDWTLQALIQAANYFLVRNDVPSYLPLFRACADLFPDAPAAAGCHWKVAWRAYLDHREEAESLLKEHLLRFPSSDRAGAALYYLGRLSEERGNSAEAQAYFSEIQSRFPNFYYAILAASRPQPAADGAGSAAAVRRFLDSIRWPERPRKADFEPDEEARWRIQRARILAAAAQENWAEIELRFGARNGAACYALAMEAAEIAARRGAWGVSIRHIRGAAPDYLWLPRGAAPKRFWELAFPFPYRDAIRREAHKHGLDPLLMAALIRQESEFDKDAVSPAGAIGLMQVMPATGRELGRRLRMGAVTRKALHNPSTNLALGAYYLARQLELRGGSVEQALAAYNAGPTRIPIWREWGDFREPSEFVETIPLLQTRDYVQIILRNLEFYRWLYGQEMRKPLAPAAGAPSAPAAAAAKPPAKKAAPSKTGSRKTPARKGASPSARKR
jgi:soluble lytic murein transglycosylase